MGKGLKAGKRKHKSPKVKIVSVDKGIMRTLLLVCAYLADGEGWDEDHIAEFYEKITEWGGAINDHLIDIRQVADIINSKLGGNFIRWE